MGFCHFQPEELTNTHTDKVEYAQKAIKDSKLVENQCCEVTVLQFKQINKLKKKKSWKLVENQENFMKEDTPNI